MILLLYSSDDVYMYIVFTRVNNGPSRDNKLLPSRGFHNAPPYIYIHVMRVLLFFLFSVLFRPNRMYTRVGSVKT